MITEMNLLVGIEQLDIRILGRSFKQLNKDFSTKFSSKFDSSQCFTSSLEVQIEVFKNVDLAHTFAMFKFFLSLLALALFFMAVELLSKKLMLRDQRRKRRRRAIRIRRPPPFVY